MLSPKDFKDYEETKIYIDGIIKELDEGLKSSALRYEDKVEVILRGEYPKQVRDKIAQQYTEVGWSKVTHQTSSENGERPGLTSFAFYF